jgi:hypothetical protein
MSTRLSGTIEMKPGQVRAGSVGEAERAMYAERIHGILVAHILAGGEQDCAEAGRTASEWMQAAAVAVSSGGVREIPFPAPWRVDAYFAAGRGVHIWRVLAHDHSVVLDDCGEGVARRVVEAREASGGETAAVASVQARWQAALNAAHAETHRVREHFQAENARLRETIGDRFIPEHLRKARPTAPTRRTKASSDATTPEGETDDA